MRLAIQIAAILLLGSIAFGQSIPSISPIKDFQGKTSEFGKRIHPVLKSERQHDAIDLFVPEGTPVLATGDGRVSQAETIDGYGLVVRIEHKNHFQTLYAHLSKVAVKPGQIVKQGQAIAYSGKTGLSSAPHLHYEVAQNGVSIDPRKLMASK